MRRILIEVGKDEEFLRLHKTLSEAGLILEPADENDNGFVARVPVAGESGAVHETPAQFSPAPSSFLYPTDATLRQCIYHAPAAIAILDRDMRYLAWSEHWLLDYHLGKMDLTGLSHYDVFPDIPDIWKEIHHRCLEGAIDRCDEAAFPRADGTIDWISWEIRPWFDDGGNIGGLIILSEVITEQVETEQTLSSREELLKAVEAMTHVGGWEFDVASGKGFWTDEVARIHELDEHFPGRDIGLSFYHGESRKRIEAAVAAASKDGKPYDLELELVTAKGNTRWIRTIGRPVMDNDRVIRVTGSFQDITERKLAEQSQQEELLRLQRQLQAVGRIAETGALLAGNLELAAREITELATQVSGAGRANVWLFNADESELHCIDNYEATPARHSAGLVLKEAEYSNEFQALKTGKSVAADDPLTDPRTAGYVESYLKPLGITAKLDTVIHASGKHFGLLCIEHVNTPHHWEHDELVFAEQLADKLAFCMVNRERQEAIQKLRLANSVVEASNTMVYRHATTAGWPLTFISDNVAQFGYNAAELIETDTGYDNLLHPEDRRVATAALLQAEDANANEFERQYRILTTAGEPRWLDDKCTVARDLDGRITHVQGVVTDITARRIAETKIERLNRLYRVTSGINTLIVRVSEREELFQEACQIAAGIGRFPLVWIGMVNSAGDAVIPVAWEGRGENLIRAIDNWPIHEGDDAGPGIRAITCNQPVFINDVDAEPESPWKRLVSSHGFRAAAGLPLIVAGKAVGVVCIHAAEKDFFDAEEIALLTELAGDVSFALHHIAQREKVTYLTSFDPLTGLPNRSQFLTHLTALMKQYDADVGRFSLLLFDLKEFRNINSVYGRTAGDRVLQESVRRLSELIDDPGDLARIGNDVFALVVRKLTTAQDISLMFEHRITPLLNQREFQLKTDKILLHFIAGISLFPDDAHDAETLLHNAEVALRRAKATNAPYVFYRTEMTARIAEAVSLQNRLRQALDQQQFVLYYQPKINAVSRRITGLEALLRWNDPNSGLVSPDKFIPLLEKSGMILDVGLWVLEQATRDYLMWEQRLPEAPRIAVNVSELQLQQDDFVTRVLQATSAKGKQVPFELEITESLIMKDVENSIDKLVTLQKSGLTIAIDDFGTGYSSLSHIARLPLDALKIDRSFVDSMLTKPESGIIVETIISMAHTLNLKVVAEGVETEPQAARLLELYCEELQGFLFSKPLPADMLWPLLSGTSGFGTSLDRGNVKKREQEN